MDQVIIFRNKLIQHIHIPYHIIKLATFKDGVLLLTDRGKVLVIIGNNLTLKLLDIDNIIGISGRDNAILLKSNGDVYTFTREYNRVSRIFDIVKINHIEKIHNVIEIIGGLYNPDLFGDTGGYYDYYVITYDNILYHITNLEDMYPERVTDIPMLSFISNISDTKFYLKGVDGFVYKCSVGNVVKDTYLSSLIYSNITINSKYNV